MFCSCGENSEKHLCRVQGFNRPEFKRPESKHPLIQSPIVQKPSARVQASRVQESMDPESKRPESRRPDHASRVQLFRYFVMYSLQKPYISNKLSCFRVPLIFQIRIKIHENICSSAKS